MQVPQSSNKTDAGLIQACAALHRPFFARQLNSLPAMSGIARMIATEIQIGTSLVFGDLHSLNASSGRIRIGRGLRMLNTPDIILC